MTITLRTSSTRSSWCISFSASSSQSSCSQVERFGWRFVAGLAVPWKRWTSTHRVYQKKSLATPHELCSIVVIERILSCEDAARRNARYIVLFQLLANVVSDMIRNIFKECMKLLGQVHDWRFKKMAKIDSDAKIYGESERRCKEPA